MAVGRPARQRTDGVTGTVDLGQVTLATSHSVWSSGIVVDVTLSFNEHVNSVCKSASFHIRALHHIRHYISEDTAKTIVLYNWLVYDWWPTGLLQCSSIWNLRSQHSLITASAEIYGSLIGGWLVFYGMSPQDRAICANLLRGITGSGVWG